MSNVTLYIVGIFVLLAIAIILFVLGFTLDSSIFFYASGSVLLMFIILAICGQKCLLLKTPSNAAKLPEHAAKIYIDQLQGIKWPFARDTGWSGSGKNQKSWA